MRSTFMIKSVYRVSLSLEFQITGKHVLNFIKEVSMVSWLSSKEMDTATQAQILAEADCILHSTNTFRKGMNPIILPPIIGK